MTIIPAIDLLDGHCVRLFQGNYSKSTIYSKDPLDMALYLYSTGIKRLHIVDLNAARSKNYNSKKDHNRHIISKIRSRVPCLIQTGGGIRSTDDVKELLDIGVDRLILGTLFANDPGTAAAWISKFGRCFIAGIDSLNGIVKIAGWEETTGLSDIELAKKAATIGMCSIIYTNIQKDGTLQGPDFEHTQKIAEAANIPVIISGGVNTIDDIKKAISMESHNYQQGVTGIIIGKALYEGTIELKAVVSLDTTNSDTMEW